MKHAHADFSALTPAEMKAALLICSGMTDREAGEALKLSHKTVNRHRTSALQKVGVRNAVEMTLKAVCAGVIHPCKVKTKNR